MRENDSKIDFGGWLENILGHSWGGVLMASALRFYENDEINKSVQSLVFIFHFFMIKFSLFD